MLCDENQMNLAGAQGRQRLNNFCFLRLTRMHKVHTHSIALNNTPLTKE